MGRIERRKAQSTAWLALATLLLLGCETAVPTSLDSPPSTSPNSTAEEVVEISGATMGTRYNVRAVLGSDLAAAQLQSQIDQRLAMINRQMSTYDPESELSRFNRDAAAGLWFEVSEDTAQVVAAALEIAAATDGAFDPTVGPLVDLWGFGPAGRRREPPPDAEIESARRRVGYQKVAARTDPPAIQRLVEDVEIDLSAIAKGFAVDRVSRLLAEAGVTGSMVEIGGEVVTRGSKPGGVPWRIGVERPTPEGRTVQTVVELSGAMATSGDYRNFFDQGGIRYSHTIDPTTGRPVTHHMTAVTVCLPTCQEADALATALLVMGPERAVAWCERYNEEAGDPIGALLLVRDEAGELTEQMTRSFQKLVAREAR